MEKTSGYPPGATINRIKIEPIQSNVDIEINKLEELLDQHGLSIDNILRIMENSQPPSLRKNSIEAVLTINSPQFGPVKVCRINYFNNAFRVYYQSINNPEQKGVASLIHLLSEPQEVKDFPSMDDDSFRRLVTC